MPPCVDNFPYNVLFAERCQTACPRRGSRSDRCCSGRLRPRCRRSTSSSRRRKMRAHISLSAALVLATVTAHAENVDSGKYCGPNNERCDPSDSEDNNWEPPPARVTVAPAPPPLGWVYGPYTMCALDPYAHGQHCYLRHHLRRWPVSAGVSVLACTIRAELRRRMCVCISCLTIGL